MSNAVSQSCCSVLVSGAASRPLILVSFLSLLWFAVVLGVAYFFGFFQIEGGSSFLAILFVFDRFLVEILFFSLVIIWLVNGKGFFRTLAYIIFFIFVLIYIIQLSAIYRGGEYVSLLALENVNHISLLINFVNILAVILFLFGSFLLIYFVEKKYTRCDEIKLLAKVSIFILILGFIVSQNKYYLPETVQEEVKSYLKQKNIEHTSPIYSLMNVFSAMKDKEESLIFTENELNELKVLGFDLQPDNAHPLRNADFEDSTLAVNGVNHKDIKPNVIVFFTEGFSARMIGAYGNSLKDLTPNLTSFSEKSIRVDNYYNHTAATYRGIYGQLCSLYPQLTRGRQWSATKVVEKSDDFYCLPNIFDKNGYETIFLDSHRKDSAYIDEMTKWIGFKEVLTAEDLSAAYLDSVEPLRKDSFSDQQFYASLIKLLEKKEKNKLETPFFISLYNLETHAWQNVAKDGVKYGNGNNKSLNTIHNLDNAFGKFIKYFNHSSFADNTIIVFTADHAHYPENSYISAVDFSREKNYQRIFIDKIPLIIYDPFIDSPLVFDAKNATSIDFSPSLIHYLSLKSFPNSFLGKSIFNEKNNTNRKVGVSVIGGDIYLIDDDMIHTKNNSSKYTKERNLLGRFIDASHWAKM